MAEQALPAVEFSLQVGDESFAAGPPQPYSSTGGEGEAYAFRINLGSQDGPPINVRVAGEAASSEKGREDALRITAVARILTDQQPGRNLHRVETGFFTPNIAWPPAPDQLEEYTALLKQAGQQALDGFLALRPPKN